MRNLHLFPPTFLFSLRCLSLKLSFVAVIFAAFISAVKKLHFYPFLVMRNLSFFYLFIFRVFSSSTLTSDPSIVAPIFSFINEVKYLPLLPFLFVRNPDFFLFFIPPCFLAPSQTSNSSFVALIFSSILLKLSHLTGIRNLYFSLFLGVFWASTHTSDSSFVTSTSLPSETFPSDGFEKSILFFSISSSFLVLNSHHRLFLRHLNLRLHLRVLKLSHISLP